ncbi:hypothetical protein CN957_02425 [Bacillus cereus]|uniref:hypothetical protein n=1 Tax=Bacillus nitratireducens TaxID=2026193 RepID=UPI000BF6674A|nr:hypothetical protein COI95_17825 [Bacillus cereus]PFK06482.1 hypothetical protein COI97_01175 [Bacillus cereus]PGM86285.1 hypothetical protein CN957_02425 [Bacillus cereus]
MKNILKNDIYRACINWRFYGLIIAGIIISCMYTYQTMSQDYQSALLSKEYGKYMIGTDSWFNFWIGFDGMKIGAIWYLLIPILASLPYSDSYLIDKQTNYISTMYSKINRFQYMLSKYLVTFFTGGIVIILPFLLNFVYLVTFLPNVLPENQYMGPVQYEDPFAFLFYINPILFVLMYLVFIFILSGLYACVSLAFSKIFRNRFIVLLSAFILYFMNIVSSEALANPELSLFKIVQPGPNVTGIKEIYLPISLFICLLISLTFFIGEKKRDIY